MNAYQNHIVFLVEKHQSIYISHFRLLEMLLYLITIYWFYRKLLSQMKHDFCSPHLHIAFYTTTTLLSSNEIVVLFENYLNRFSFNILGNVRSWKHQTKLLFLEKKNEVSIILSLHCTRAIGWSRKIV